MLALLVRFGRSSRRIGLGGCDSGGLVPSSCAWVVVKISGVRFARADGVGARSPAHARGRVPWLAGVASSSIFEALTLCGHREWGLRPGTHTIDPSGGQVSQESFTSFDVRSAPTCLRISNEPPGCCSRRVVGLAGAGPIRGCHRARAPTLWLTKKPGPGQAAARERGPENASHATRQREVCERNATPPASEHGDTTTGARPLSSKP